MRPKMLPATRFADVMPILEHADMYEGLKYRAIDERNAIYLCHRMNLCRKAIAEENPNTRLYRFVIRAVGNEVHIAPRQIIDLSNCTLIDGSPLPIPADQLPPGEYERLYAEARRKAGLDPEAPLDLDE